MVVGRYGDLKYGIYGINGREQRFLPKQPRNPGRIGDFEVDFCRNLKMAWESVAIEKKFQTTFLWT